MASENKVVRLSDHMTVSVSTEALEALRALATKKTRLVMLLVPGPPDAAHPSTVAEVVQTISPTEPRFTFCRFKSEITGGHRTRRSCSSSPVPRRRPARWVSTRTPGSGWSNYPLEVARAETGLNIDKKFEVEDPAELDEALVLGEPKASKTDE
ncbi:hypothetical protein B0H66DRAFT_638332 [Apodospora peruviana]|uniref:Uncharacterized protein n=1 Tax=Apodospora peruviana TaxID=516989 RepID=A0AAE0M7G9_9PEZI|nr:hypothetical protein B0H66DRAFT_638332 [Apodospora peruviana]